MGDADLWDMLTKSGIHSDSATAIVRSHKSMNDADLWDRLTQNGAKPDAATAIVKSRSAPNTDLSLRNLGRSVTQGATFGFGDELGLTDRAKENAFKAEHPWIDAGAKTIGMIPAAVGAIAAAPVLGTTAGGSALLGGGLGLLSGVGESDTGDPTARLESGVKGGLLGSLGSLIGYGAGKVVGGTASKILDRKYPARAVARAAGGILDPATAAATASRMAAVDAIAPGGSSIATASVPADGTQMSQFLPTLRGVGASPAAAASAETSIRGQRAVLEAARKAIGSKMDAIGGDIPAPPQTVLDQVKEVLGSKAPDVTGAMMPVQDARTALSRLRYDARTAAAQGTNVNGVRLHEINQARAALQAHIYQHAPAFQALDQPYATVMDQLGHAEDALETVQRSRGNYAGNEAYGATAGSLGGSLPRGSHGVIMTALDKLLTNKAGAADAVARLIAKPGGPEMVKGLLDLVPQTSSRSIAGPAAGVVIPQLRGLLFPQDSQP